MLVKEVMSKKFITVKSSLNLLELIKLFRTYHFHRFPVVDEEDTIIGTVSIESVMEIFKPHSKHLTRMLQASPSLKVDGGENDILDTSISHDFIKTTLVSDLMERNLVTIDADNTTSDACSLMKLHNRQGLPVVKNNKLVGVVTLFDIIYALFREKGFIE